MSGGRTAQASAGARLDAVECVRLEADASAAADVRAFYTRVAGLTELTATGDELRFAAGRFDLRIQLLTNPQVDPIPTRAVLAVRSLSDAMKRLEAAGWDFEVHRGLLWSDRRLSVLDPCGNRVEFKRDWPYAPF